MSAGMIQPGGVLMPGSPLYETWRKSFATPPEAGKPPPGVHPLADLFPMLEDKHRQTFRASLSEKQNHAVVLHLGLLLDGRNRARELIELGKPINHVVFIGTSRQALDFVNAENLERRHLTESQRAMAAARTATLKLGDNQHRTTAAPTGAPSLFVETAPAADNPPAQPLISQSEAADVYNVGRRSVQRAAVVIEKGAPELQEAVKQGDVTVSAAAEIAALPIEEQRAIVAAADPKVVKEISKQNRVEKAKVGRERRLKNMATGDATPLLDGGGKVGVFYVDIPREFVKWSEETGAEKSPENHYRVEDFDFLCNMRDKILARAEPNAVIFMWAWANSLQDQLDLLVEWGFASIRRRDETGRLLRGADGRILPPVGEGRYRTQQVWAKRSANGNLHQGMGFWFRDCHELLLVGARGDVPAPLQGTQALSIVDGLIGKHSEKPNEMFRDQIDHYFPGVRKLEMFGRTKDPAAFRARHPEWEMWGNHAPQSAPSAEAAE